MPLKLRAAIVLAVIVGLVIPVAVFSLISLGQRQQAAFHEIEAKNRALQQGIEQRARTEQELQCHREHLEELVRERTAELTVATERAEIGSQAKACFALHGRCA